MNFNKRNYLDLIKSNIKKYGFHFTVVQQAVEPRYAYTIGCYGVLGFEMIFAGGIYYSRDDLDLIFYGLFDYLKNVGNTQADIKIDDLGTFKLRLIDNSWKEAMSLKVLDHFDSKNVEVYQILPGKNHFTLDIPNMSEVWSLNDPIWKWLKVKWPYNVPEDSLVTTNLDALFGKKITEVSRWELDDWEMFAGAGQDTNRDEIRVVPLGLMIGIDPSLLPSMRLAVDEGLRRESEETAWEKW